MDNEKSIPVRKNRKYSKVFKKKVAWEYLEGKHTSMQLGEKYGIRFQRVLDWANEYSSNIDKGRSPLSPMTIEEQKEFDALKEQVEALKKEAGIQ